MASFQSTEVDILIVTQTKRCSRTPLPSTEVDILIVTQTAKCENSQKTKVFRLNY